MSLKELKQKIAKNRAFGYALYMLIGIIGLTLLILPADFFDEGDSVCVSVMFFDLECYACGMTRAIQHLIHLDIQAAYTYNKLSFVVLPLILYLLGTSFYQFLKATKEN